AVVGWSANLGPTLADALAWWSDGSVLTGNPGVDPGLVPGIPFFGISGVALDIPGAPAGGPYNNIWRLASEGAIQGMELSDYLIIFSHQGSDPSSVAGLMMPPALARRLRRVEDREGGVLSGQFHPGSERPRLRILAIRAECTGSRRLRAGSWLS